MIFQREGLKGEIKTTLPIEKISVSEQGIVSVIVKNEFIRASSAMTLPEMCWWNCRLLLKEKDIRLM